jgi:hypothetical protein
VFSSGVTRGFGFRSSPIDEPRAVPVETEHDALEMYTHVVFNNLPDNIFPVAARVQSSWTVACEWLAPPGSSVKLSQTLRHDVSMG